MIVVAADLHVHTCLSPCADRDMRPPALLAAALDLGLGMIGVCDHNTAANARPLVEASAGRLAVIPGMEITTSEEAHVVGLFPDCDLAEAAAREVAEGLPACRHPEEQERFAADGRTIGIEPLMLAAASRFTLEQTVELVRRHGGLAIAAHVDRRSFSVTSQLGFLPPGVRFHALEVSAYGVRAGRVPAFQSSGIPVTTASDAHALESLGEAILRLAVEEASFAELARALAGAEGRGYAVA
jgi:PHP family Zn ribbon phosphoesterase